MQDVTNVLLIVKYLYASRQKYTLFEKTERERERIVHIRFRKSSGLL